MALTRRQFGMIAGAIALAGRSPRAGATARQDVALILAPSNLGLRPENGKEPGTWEAPQVLADAGLAQAIGAVEVVGLPRPAYHFDAEPGTRLRNGHSIRAFSLELAGLVRRQLEAGRFPVVAGGDCSVLLGGLYGARLAGARGLVHVDGHSDFTQEKSYPTPETLGAVAGMDLALASGRGEALLTDWPQVGTLAADADIVQIGERGRDEPWFPAYYGDILATQITQLTVQSAKAEGIATTAAKALARLAARGIDRAWLHVDLDVLDEKVMNAVDSPGTPGFDYAELSALIGALVASGRIVGADFAIYDPARDPGHRHAKDLVACIAEGLRNRPPRES